MEKDAIEPKTIRTGPAIRLQATASQNLFEEISASGFWTASSETLMRKSTNNPQQMEAM